jgi:hypothetical protein
MPFVKKVLCWIFAVTSLLYLENLYQITLYGMRRHYAPSLFLSVLLAVAFDILVVGFSGMAWWSIWKEMPSAKGWAIAASAMHILIFLRQFIFPSQLVWGRHAGALVIGIVGLIAFLWPDGRVSGSEPLGPGT